MTAATAAVPGQGSHGARGGSVLQVALALVRRNLVGIVRLPSAVIPSLIFPLFGTIAFASVYGAAIRQYYPDLPNINWYVPLNVLQGAAFGSVFLAFGTIRDFQTGVFDRLAAAPLSRSSLLLANLITAVLRSFLPVVIVLFVGVLGGMSMPGGPLALAVLLLATWAIALIGVSWGVALAYRFKSMSAAPLMQVAVFVLVFLSESQVPAEGLTGWLEVVSRYNPATYILRMGRQGFLGEVTWAETWPGLVAFAGMFVVVAGFAWSNLRRALGD
jgi:ABC-2 type transport system permease protein